MKYYILFLIIIPKLFFGQISNEKQKLLEPLLKLNYAESSNIGVGGEPSKIYEKFQSIKSKFNNKELLFLARNSSNALRLYSSQELVRRNENLIVSLYYYYKKYPLKFRYTNGCISEIKDLSEMIKLEFDNIIFQKTELERMLSSIKKDNTLYKKDELYIYYEQKLKKIASIVNSNFNNSYEKIKEINTNFDKETGKTSNYSFPED